MSDLVNLSPDQDVAVITIQNPPVNALSPGMPEGMAAALEAALCDWGMAIGIFAVDDMGGLDVQWHVPEERKLFEKPGLRQPLALAQLYRMGRLGQKTGAGWYRYDGNRKPAPDPEVLALVEKAARENCIPRRTITTGEILERSIYILINEGARILEEGHALRAADIDTIYLTSYGFPPHRGGPMWYADTVGLKKVYRRVEEFHALYGELWALAPLLKHLAEERGTFAAFDAAKESLACL
jgi:3-hydroxyacyl-CoA dehydrogenase